MDLYQIWFRGSSRGRNQMCGILLQSAHGFRFCERSKFAISHWLGRSPLTQCWRYRAACDCVEGQGATTFSKFWARSAFTGFHRLRGSASTVLTATDDGDGEFWPLTESKPMSWLQQNSAHLITSARKPPKPNLVQIHLLGATGHMGEI